MSMTPETYAPPVSLGQAYADLLREERDAAGPKPTADGTLFRASDARSCSRKRVLAALGAEPDHDPNDDTLKAFATGTEKHTALQRVITEKWGGKVEQVSSYRDLGVELSGSSDGYVYRVPPLFDAAALIEIKTMKRFGWNVAVHGAGDPRWKNKAEPGPKLEHIVQAGLYAMSPQVQAEYLHLVYVCKDDDAIAEWFIHLDDPLTHAGGASARTLVEEELADVRELTACVEAGVVPAPYLPGHGPIDVELKPAYGAAKGNPWMCRYCPFADTCEAMGNGDVAVGMQP